MTTKNTLTLKQRVLQSGSWTLVGYGVSQAIRFGGNLVLTRLLFPEAFGIMAIIQAVIFGIWMLTDVGIGPSIVQKAQGNETSFLNTAWAVQVIRGFLIWIVLCILTIPLASIYAEPQLTSIIPVVGLVAIISSFNSTKLFTAQRNLEVARATQIDIGSQALGLLCTIYLAWSMRSVWALVWGQLITASLKMLSSHLLLKGVSNRFEWNRDAVRHLTGFGRWILLTSSLSFLSLEGARLVIGAALDMRQLALFTLANSINLILWQAARQLAYSVYFSAYAELNRANPERLMPALYKTRLALILPNWIMAVIFVFFGTQIMGVLYDERYSGAGIMLEQLAAGSLVGCIWGSYAGVFLGLGKVVTDAIMISIQIACQFGAMYVGYHYMGGAGIILGLAAANWLTYPIHAFVIIRHGLWQPKLDFIFLTCSAVIIAIAWHRLA